jgi:hypothetical protein
MPTFCLLSVTERCRTTADTLMEIPIKYRVLDVRRRAPTSGLRTLTAKTGVRVP